jgi:hypothetical protein
MVSKARNCLLEPAGVAHCTEVSVVQIDVRQLDEPITEVGVESLKPKFLPEKVTIVPPDETLFWARTKETTGESKEKTPKRVPISPSIVATIGIALPKPSST